LQDWTDHQALLRLQKKVVPLQGAGTQNNLGNALGMLGARESGTARLSATIC
jgi:hypothetical protein